MGPGESSLRLSRAVALACAGSALFVGGCGLVLDFDPDPVGGTTIDSGTPEVDARPRRDGRAMDTGDDDGGVMSDATRPDAVVVDAHVLDADEDGGDASTDAGPPFVCADPSGPGECSGVSCDDDVCGPAVGDRCQDGQCVCGDDATKPCRLDQHEVCADTTGAAGCVCEPDWMDCDRDVPGCETNVMADATSCGGCGTSCAPGEACVSGTCRACTGDADCGDADGLPCTVPRCKADGECTESIGPETCLIDGRCVGDDERNEQNACEVCEPASSTTQWSPAALNEPCDDADACTDGDRCDGMGACALFDPTSCAPPDACHIARCDPARGCEIDLMPGFCSIGGACVPAGAPVAPSEPCIVCDPAADPFGYTSHSSGEPCDDGLPCTDTSCGSGSVCRVDRATGCFAAGACFDPGDPDPGNPCIVCAADASTRGWTNAPVGTECNTTAGGCLFGAACNGEGLCAPVICTTSLGLTCSGGTECRCAIGRADCDDRVDNGCECVGVCGACADGP